ncbi:hypothetical protein RHMOL_Rhmol02G0053100 [Rhododendron molle]|uniref:Uncharacterized protein n=1 Tax=Rhododendron molle TaxID=49168 RepID=A0ACC0PM92_RHOML|nr:hypothetical protein RHMOL_Rhmol02G0053100 [Rhododendron molle]
MRKLDKWYIKLFASPETTILEIRHLALVNIMIFISILLAVLFSFAIFYWNSKARSFAVYKQSLAGTCEHGLVHYDCFWQVTPTGFYLSNDDKHYRLINSS